MSLKLVDIASMLNINVKFGKIFTFTNSSVVEDQ